MKHLAIFLAGLILTSAALADWFPLGSQQFDINFVSGATVGCPGAPPVTPAQCLTVSRASTAWEDNTTGTWSSFTSNTLRITNKGTLIEEARTNVALWNRDLTNAAWTASNVTVAHTYTGIDGLANSASSLTATAGNGTVLQAITLASSARFESAFVQRIAGTGVVNMTMDNGATWTAVTPCAAGANFGSSACRVTIPTQTLANPTVGFQIVTNGDAIAVDFVQNENGTFATSPILVTTVAVARAADVVTITRPPAYGGAGFSLYVSVTLETPTGYSNNLPLLAYDDGVINNCLEIRTNTANVETKIFTGGSPTGNSTSSATWSQNSTSKIAGGFDASTTTSALNGALSSDGSVTGLPTSASLSQLTIGTGRGSAPVSGYFTEVAVWPGVRLPNATLQSLTQ